MEITYLNASLNYKFNDSSTHYLWETKDEPASEDLAMFSDYRDIEEYLIAVSSSLPEYRADRMKEIFNHMEWLVTKTWLSRRVPGLANIVSSDKNPMTQFKNLSYQWLSDWAVWIARFYEKRYFVLNSSLEISAMQPVIEEFLNLWESLTGVDISDELSPRDWLDDILVLGWYLGYYAMFALLTHCTCLYRTPWYFTNADAVETFHDFFVYYSESICYEVHRIACAKCKIRFKWSYINRVFLHTEVKKDSSVKED